MPFKLNDETLVLSWDEDLGNDSLLVAMPGQNGGEIIPMWDQRDKRSAPLVSYFRQSTTLWITPINLLSAGMPGTKVTEQFRVNPDHPLLKTNGADAPTMPRSDSPAKNGSDHREVENWKQKLKTIKPVITAAVGMLVRVLRPRQQPKPGREMRAETNERNRMKKPVFAFDKGALVIEKTGLEGNFEISVCRGDKKFSVLNVSPTGAVNKIVSVGNVYSESIWEEAPEPGKYILRVYAFGGPEGTEVSEAGEEEIIISAEDVALVKVVKEPAVPDTLKPAPKFAMNGQKAIITAQGDENQYLFCVVNSPDGKTVGQQFVDRSKETSTELLLGPFWKGFEWLKGHPNKKTPYSLSWMAILNGDAYSETESIALTDENVEKAMDYKNRNGNGVDKAHTEAKGSQPLGNVGEVIDKAELGRAIKHCASWMKQMERDSDNAEDTKSRAFLHSLEAGLRNLEKNLAQLQTEAPDNGDLKEIAKRVKVFKVKLEVLWKKYKETEAAQTAKIPEEKTTVIKPTPTTERAAPDPAKTKLEQENEKLQRQLSEAARLAKAQAAQRPQEQPASPTTGSATAPQQQQPIIINVPAQPAPVVNVTIPPQTPPQNPPTTTQTANTESWWKAWGMVAIVALIVALGIAAIALHGQTAMTINRGISAEGLKTATMATMDELHRFRQDVQRSEIEDRLRHLPNFTPNLPPPVGQAGPVATPTAITNVFNITNVTNVASTPEPRKAPRTKVRPASATQPPPAVNNSSHAENNVTVNVPPATATTSGTTGVHKHGCNGQFIPMGSSQQQVLNALALSNGSMMYSYPGTYYCPYCGVWY